MIRPTLRFVVRAVVLMAVAAGLAIFGRALANGPVQYNPTHLCRSCADSGPWPYFTMHLHIYAERGGAWRETDVVRVGERIRFALTVKAGEPPTTWMVSFNSERTGPGNGVQLVTWTLHRTYVDHGRPLVPRCRKACRTIYTGDYSLVTRVPRAALRAVDTHVWGYWGPATASSPGAGLSATDYPLVVTRGYPVGRGRTMSGFTD